MAGRGTAGYRLYRYLLYLGEYYFFSYFLLKAEPINHTVIDFGSLIGLKSQKDFGSLRKTLEVREAWEAGKTLEVRKAWEAAATLLHRYSLVWLLVCLRVA